MWPAVSFLELNEVPPKMLLPDAFHQVLKETWHKPIRLLNTDTVLFKTKYSINIILGPVKKN